MSVPLTPATAVLMVADPDDTPVSVLVMPGGTVEWSSESTTFPNFEIKFLGASPVPDGTKLKGTTTDPVIVQITQEEHIYRYKIRHTKADGTGGEETGPFAVRSCRVCG